MAVMVIPFHRVGLRGRVEILAKGSNGIGPKREREGEQWSVGQRGSKDTISPSKCVFETLSLPPASPLVHSVKEIIYIKKNVFTFVCQMLHLQMP